MPGGLGVSLHQLPQQRGALHLRDAKAGRFLTLRVVRGDGGGIDHERRAVDVFGLMPDGYGNAAFTHGLNVIAVVVVGPGNGKTAARQQSRKAGHGAAAYADHMHALAGKIIDMHPCAVCLLQLNSPSIIRKCTRGFNKNFKPCRSLAENGSGQPWRILI